MGQLVDVSRPIWAGMPKIGVLPDVSIDTVTSIDAGRPLNISMLHLPSHAGTHIDAPCHAIAGAASIDEIAVDRFVSPGVVVPIEHRAGELIEVADLAAAGVDVRAGDIVLFSTGWAAHFESGGYDDHPALSPDLAAWLVARRANMVGVDMVTVDAAVPRRTPDFAYPVHRTLLGAGVLIIENLADLSAFAGRRVTVHAAPLAVRGGDAGHARVLLEEAA